MGRWTGGFDVMVEGLRRLLDKAGGTRFKLLFPAPVCLTQQSSRGKLGLFQRLFQRLL